MLNAIKERLKKIEGEFRSPMAIKADVKSVRELAEVNAHHIEKGLRAQMSQTTEQGEVTWCFTG